MLSSLNVLKNYRLAASISVLALTISLAACGGQQTPDNTATKDTPSGTATDTTASSPAKLDLGGNVKLTGAGASFPAPLYDTWFTDLNKKYPNLQVDYASVGSGAGVEQFIKGTVDFGASDVAMKPEEIQKVPQDKGVVLLPMTAGSIVLAYNLPDAPELKLPRAVYTDILLGKIKTWNDPKIAAANPGAKLPNQPIVVVYRSDGSGTSVLSAQSGRVKLAKAKLLTGLRELVPKVTRVLLPKSNKLKVLLVTLSTVTLNKTISSLQL
jgi:phosphate transport system substrate-binding protein